jgi:hypothetical protein
MLYYSSCKFCLHVRIRTGHFYDMSFNPLPIALPDSNSSTVYLIAWAVVHCGRYLQKIQVHWSHLMLRKGINPPKKLPCLRIINEYVGHHKVHGHRLEINELAHPFGVHTWLRMEEDKMERQKEVKSYEKEEFDDMHQDIERERRNGGYRY